MRTAPNHRGLPSRARSAAPGRRALTLIEVLISLALIAMIMASMFTFYWQTGEIRRQAAEMSARTNLARNILSEMEKELRGVLGAEQIGFPSTQGEQRLAGTRRSITFLSSLLPDKDSFYIPSANDEPPPGRHDLQLLSYSLWIDPENKTEEGEPIVGGLMRTQKRTLNQYVVDEEDPLDVRNDLWAPEIGYLEFRFFDGVEWDTTWDITDGNSLPQLIQITIGFTSITDDELNDVDLQTYPVTEYPFGDPMPREDRFSTIIRLPAADRFFSSRVSRVGKQMTESMGVEGDSLK